MSRFTSEEDMARHVVAWLNDQHWEVYQEVSTGYSEARADIVATQDRLSWIVETKTTMSLDLMAQAFNWVGRANFVSVAVPLRPRSMRRGYHLALRLLRDRGIGVVEVDEVCGCHSVVAPRLVRRIARPIADLLCDAHKTMADAGSARGGYHTAFATTCRVVTRFVKDHPGCTMRELVDGIEHHYLRDSTARSCLRQWAGTKKIPGVELRREGRKLYLFPAGDESVDA